MSNEYLDTLETGLTAKMKRRFYIGEFIDDSEGALWSQRVIDNNRVPYQNAHNLMQSIPLAQIAIGVDPATSVTEESDLTGIVAVGVGEKLSKEGREHLYVMSDRSGKYSPNEWAKEAINLYNNLEANCIVAEANQGGDMITEILRNNGFRGKIELVHASKGKLTRAEPWEALYEQGYVHHITSSELAELEVEMTTYSPYLLTGKDASPDRMDAMVWAGNYLTQHNNHARYRRQIDPEEFKKNAHKQFPGWR
jgi:phage terminase large subunit-like protein